MDFQKGNKFSGGNCTRCLHIKLRSRNVIQILTEGLGACYTTEEAAEATCPKDNMLDEYNNKDKSILLYKTKDFAIASLDGVGEIKYDYCPINGKFQFVYQTNDGSESKMECLRPMSSEIDNCPNGSEVNLRFRGCSFDNHDIKFKCLGSWDGPENQKYIALLDTRESIEGSPRYRCALMEEETGGKIHLAFSSDSTCFSDLRSARDGFEQLTLSSLPSPAWPAQVTLNSCTFPGWTQGHWESAYIAGNSLTYKDQINFKTHSIRCIEASLDKHDRFFVFARSQCGEEMYSCIWMKKRGLNVLEFQLGLKSSNHLNTSLCSDFNFQSTKWITQGRLERYQEAPCPITGEYHGMIPDTDGLCAKLSSDCTSPETMYYTVVDCNAPEIYEERQYRCLGQWTEGGLTYTYTQRQDIGTYECFVGAIVSNNEIFIKEAGEHCERELDPSEYGMRLTRKGSCTGDMPLPVPITERSTTTTTTSTTTTTTTTTRAPWTPPTRRTTVVTRPWKPVTAPPHRVREDKVANSASTLSLTLSVSTATLIALVLSCYRL
ncbi:hypothetical protein M8J77_012502 [Diaphorina citri]|nr:hypothetical protein M8J77_012502 [Diaphorina citri]